MRTEPASVEYRRAWLSLLLFPFSFVGAFVLGEGLAGLFGQAAADDQPVPLWVAIAAGGPALLVLVVPSVLAVYFGRRARRLGKREAVAPMVVGATLAVAFVGQNVLSYLLQVVFD